MQDTEWSREIQGSAVEDKKQQGTPPFTHMKERTS